MGTVGDAEIVPLAHWPEIETARGIGVVSAELV